MAKDPAFLFYPNDWMGGTMIFSRHQKGCYIDLLVAQFNNGPLSLETIKTVLGQDQATWTVLSGKFKQDSTGNFYNERLAAEMEKRRNFSLKQKMNGLKGGRKTQIKPKLNPNESLLEDGNRNENEEEEIELPENGFFCDSLEKEILLTDVQTGATIEFIQLICDVILAEKDVGKYWEAFKIQHFSKREWYNSYENLLTHFRNSLKLELKNDGKGKSNSKGNGSATSRSVEALLSGLDGGLTDSEDMDR